ncbi:MAG: hypothetical protein J6W29_10225, partial [Neisseriaceae bacterium]|nr:hypothetical protein [Neisseriaceae bacterium]
QRALDEVKNNKEQEINDKEQEIENTAADDENLAELENDLEHLQDEYDELQSADDLLTRLGYGIEEFDEYDNGESLETIVDLVNQLDSAFVDIPTGYGRGISDLNDTIKNWRESPANPDNGLVGKCFEPTDEETLLDIVATDGFKKWFRPEKVASELKESRLLPKVWYRGLSGVSGEEVDKLKATSKYSDYAGEYYAYTPATAMSYIGDLANGKLLAGFLNVPEDKLAVLDCKGSSFADIGFKSTVAEQCEVFLAFGFDEEPNNWQDFDFVQTVKLAKTKDTISFYLQYANARGCLLVVDKDFEEQEYSQNRLAEYFSGRVEYALEHNYTKTNFYAWNLAIRGDYWAVMFENIHDFGGNYGKELRGTIGQDDIICVFAPNAYFKELHNKGEFNPEDNRIFYSLFDVEQDFKQEMQAEKEKTMQQTQTTATNGGVSLSKHTENTAKLDLSGQPESVLQYIKMANHPFIDDKPYFNALTPEQQVFVRQYLDSMNNEREQNQTVSNNEIHPDEISWRDEIVYLSLRYEEIDGVSIYHDKGLMNRPLNQLSQVELEDRLNIAEYLLSEALVRTQDSEVWNDLQKQVNEVQNEMEHRKQQEVQLAAENGGFSLSNPQSEKENTMNTQNDTIFQFSNGYTVVISDYFEQEIKENNGRVDDFTQVYIYHKDRITPVAEYWYSVDCLDSEKWAFNQDSVKSRSEFVLNKENENPTSAMDYVQEPYGHRKSFSVNILGDQNWKENLAHAMVDFAVSYEVKTGLNADKEVSGSPEIVSVTRDNYYAANRYYAQNTAQNPVFLAEDDNAVVMPFDDFVIAAMKDTGDSREEIIAFANEAFRSQYQAADGYLRAAIDGSIMYNAFDIEIEDKTYYATAPLEWVKEQARVGLSDRGWDLENARHNFLHSSLENNQWETAFHQLKAAADDYKQWRNKVCAFFNFNQPEITLQQGEWTQVAQFVNYNQEWEQLDNARLLIAEFTPQQAFEFLGVYQQYQRYVSLAEHNAEQGVDNT